MGVPKKRGGGNDINKKTAKIENRFKKILPKFPKSYLEFIQTENGNPITLKLEKNRRKCRISTFPKSEHGMVKMTFQ